MKLHIVIRLWLVLLVFCAAACNSSNSREQAISNDDGKTVTTPTVIYLVRHAEKDVSEPKNEDPGLTPAGEARAAALLALLEGQEVDALYATKYIRTINTLKPLAAARQLEIQQYEAHDFNSLKEQILQQHLGETVVIAGHSNTLLPILEAFGVKRPVADIPDNKYDFLFRLTVAPDGSTAVETSQFGSVTN